MMDPRNQSDGRGVNTLANDVVLYWFALCVATASVLLIHAYYTRKSPYPLVNPPGFFQYRAVKQLEYISDSVRIISEARARYGVKPFRLLNELGQMVVLPNTYAHVIRNEPLLDFRTAVKKAFHSHIGGFEAFNMIDACDGLLPRIVKTQLTKRLSTVTKPLSDESRIALDVNFGNSTEWKEFVVKEKILDVVARVSTRVFMGDKLCRNDEWLKITQAYTVDSFKAAFQLSLLPNILVPIFSRILPGCRVAKQHFWRARQIIQPVVDERRLLRAKAREANEPIPYFDDVLDWAELESNGKPFDPANLELFLSVAAIHTTTDLLGHTIILLANDPHLIKLLREEMTNVLSAHGLTKSALFNLKLLDSALKESQRVKPDSLLNMRRVVLKDLTLEGGVTLRQGERVSVETAFDNSELYEQPQKFDIYRFLKMRDSPELSRKSQLVSTSPEHLSFGHGKHACPGRFFASNEIKILMCHLLLKYDWKLAPGHTADPSTVAGRKSLNPTTRVLVRRRKEEFDFADVQL